MLNKYNNMLSLSKHLYIVDDIKWSFVDAIMKKRIKESLFWIVEYYNSGYKEETWRLLWVVYDCFYYTQNMYYAEKMEKMYKKWSKENSLSIIIGIVYKFYKINKYDFTFFNIVVRFCKYKRVNGVVDDKLRNELRMHKSHLFNKLILSLQAGHFRNVWFFVNYNLEKSLKVIQAFYKANIDFKHTNVHDIKMQIMEYVYMQNMKCRKKKKQFTIRVPHKLKAYIAELVKPYNGKPYSMLKERRLYEIPDSIGCFHLERNNYSMEEIRDNYFYNWECCANKSKYWRTIFEHWAIEFDENKQPIFINDDIHEKFYEKYNLEPDEQSNETHNKSIKYIDHYDVVDWMKSVKSI